MKKAEVVPVYLQAPFCLLFLSALLFRSVSADDQVTYLQSYCSENGHYDQGSKYGNNLDLVLYNLTSKSSTDKFCNFTTGEKSNKVYGLFLCNNVYTNLVCQRCIMLAAGEIQRRCPSSVEAAVWYIECMLRYANYSILSKNDMSIFYNLQGPPSEYSQFNQQLSETFISLSSLAATGNSSLMSATSDIQVTRDITMSCYVDCTPDLTPSDCHNCLQSALGRLQLVGSQTGVLLQLSCRLMYAFLNAGSISPGQRIKLIPFSSFLNLNSVLICSVCCYLLFFLGGGG